MYTYKYTYDIYIYRERERERERDIDMNILYFIRIYQYFSCLHFLHSCSATHNTNFSLPLPRLSIFFSCSSQKKNIINVWSRK